MTENVIGRELYTAPFIWIKAMDCTALKQNGQRWQCFDNFEVEKIVIENKKIVAISIVNTKSGKRCFTWMDEAWKTKNAKK